MIFIVVKFNIKPDWTDRWLDLTREFTESTRKEPGNLWFDWSRSVDNPNEFVLVEAFQDDAAGDHVNSAHFKQAMQDMPSRRWWRRRRSSARRSAPRAGAAWASSRSDNAPLGYVVVGPLLPPATA